MRTNYSQKTTPVGMVSWSGKRDSNPRPSAWEANALPTELFPHAIWLGKSSKSFKSSK